MESLLLLLERLANGAIIGDRMDGIKSPAEYVVQTPAMRRESIEIPMLSVFYTIKGDQIVINRIEVGT